MVKPWSILTLKRNIISKTMKPIFQNAVHFKKFWEHGNGKELLDWSAVCPDEEVFHRFSPLYHDVDETGDAAVRDTYLKMTYKEADTVIRKFSAQGVTDDGAASKAVKNLFMQMQHIPEWYDAKLAAAGADFCMRTGANGLMILRDFTLMGGYDFAYLSKPLVFTGALKKGAVKRLKDTLEFWVKVTRSDAVKPGSEAYQLIVRTRLMHSYARIKIKEKTDWDSHLWGEPINTWDMIATYTGFSLVFMQGLRKLGIIISPEEETGVFHLWKYIGYLLGIPAEYLPENRTEAVEQFYWWTTLQDKGDRDSVQLADALLRENLENTIYTYGFQRKILKNLHQSMNWFLLDEEVNRRLKIPQPMPVYSIFPKIVVKANKIMQKIYLRNPVQYRKLVAMGDEQQQKVLADYIRHTPENFHY